MEGTQSTRINVAVPLIKTLHELAEECLVVPCEIVTGTIHSALNAVSHASHALDKTMDGINVAMRLTEEEGDVDMFGCEDNNISCSKTTF